MDAIYEKGFRRVLENKILEKINKTYNLQLRDKLKLLLSHDPERRKDIYNYYRRKQSVGETFIKREKDRFKQAAINRQLTHSQVRQWSPATIDKEDKFSSMRPKSNRLKYIDVSQKKSSLIRDSKPRLNNISAKYRMEMQSRPVQSRPLEIRISYENPSPNNYAQQMQYTPASFSKPLEMYRNTPHRTKSQSLIGKSFTGDSFSKQSPRFATPRTIKLETKSVLPMKEHSPEIEPYHRRLLEDKKQKIRLKGLKMMIKEMQMLDIVQSTTSNRVPVPNEIPPESPPSKTAKQEDTISQKQSHFIEENPTQMETVFSTSYTGDSSTMKSGMKTVQYNAAISYKGELRDGKRHGKGTFFYPDGSYYTGEWVDNKMHGKGSLYFASGKLFYDGDWRDNYFNGLGKICNQHPLPLSNPFDFTDFSTLGAYWLYYEGSMVGDRRSGRGRIQLSNGEYFEGGFEGDKINGYGEFHSRSGLITYGRWADNSLVEVI